MEEIAREPSALISVSVVSHGQMDLITGLMQDIQRLCGGHRIELILTLNVIEPLTLPESNFFYSTTVIRNSSPKGFGANHNQAFKVAKGDFFCVINPDIRFQSNPFPALLTCFENTGIGVVAPLVTGPAGELEDSVRFFPTPLIILQKAMGQRKRLDYSLTHQTIEPDWVGGMFMLFPYSVFQQLNGFNEKYFLYYEDVDLCGRLQLAGFRVAVCTDSCVIHHAQRSSHRNLKYLRWHVSSMVRFFLSPVYRQLKMRMVP